jgi:hypothetical protein
MKVVIDIPADDFNAIRQGRLYFIGHDRLDQCITEAFQSCTIIPKGHGDLIDRNELFTEYPEIAIEPYINAPIVIEADKENDDDL